MIFFNDGQIVGEYNNGRSNKENVDIILEKFKGVITIL